MIGHMAMTPTRITLYIVMLSTALSISASIFCRLSLPIVFWSSSSTSSSRVALSNHHCALGRFFSLLFVCIECWISYLKRKGNSYTEGCSKLKLTETRQFQKRLVSTFEHMQVQTLDKTRCPEEYAPSESCLFPMTKAHILTIISKR